MKYFYIAVAGFIIGVSLNPDYIIPGVIGVLALSSVLVLE